MCSNFPGLLVWYTLVGFLLLPREGGLGRDFSLTMHQVRGSLNDGGGGGGGGSVHGHGHGSTHTGIVGTSNGPSGSATKTPMIRMNSRLGATHPARSKTLSGFGGVGISPTAININSGGAGAVPGGVRGHNITGGDGGSGGGIGGGVRGRGGGVMKSRTMDLSHHFSSTSPAATSTTTAETHEVRVTSRSLSPPPLQQSNQHHQQHQRPGTIRQRTWSVGEKAASQEHSDEDEPWAPTRPGGDRRNHGGEERGDEGDGGGKGMGSLPPLSPRSAAAEADRHHNGGGQPGGNRSSRNERHRVSRGSDSSHSPLKSLGSSGRACGGDGACGDGRDRDHHYLHHYQHHREEGKSPRDSGGDGGGDSPRYSPSMSPSGSPPGSSSRAGLREQRDGNWQGWGGSWEGKERDDDDDDRLLPSPRGSFPRERGRGGAGGRGGDGEEEDGRVHGRQSPASPLTARKSSSEGFKLPQSPSG